jgi:hypothetical protein
MLTAGTHPCVTPHYHSDAASNLLLLAVILRTFGVPIEMRAPAPVFPEHTLADVFLTPQPQYMIAPSLEAQRTEADLMRKMVKTEHRGRKAEERAKQQQLKWQSRTKHSHSKYGGR